MKRSDMEQLIWEAINEVEDAGVILAKIEKAGMEPPGGKWDDEEVDYATEKNWRDRYGIYEDGEEE